MAGCDPPFIIDYWLLVPETHTLSMNPVVAAQWPIDGTIMVHLSPYTRLPVPETFTFSTNTVVPLSAHTWHSYISISVKLNHLKKD